MKAASLELPKGWRSMALGSVGKWGSGGTPDRRRSNYYGGSIPWVKISDLTGGKVTSTLETITEEGLSSSSAKLLDSGTLLVAMYGASIGKLGITGMRCATNQAIAFCIPDPELATTEFLFHLLLYLQPTLIGQGKGGAQPNISQTVLKSLEVQLPPLDQQAQIVRALESIAFRRKSASQRLTAAHQRISLFRQAVLASACSGRLTSDWREQHPSIGTGSGVVEKIRRGRAHSTKAVRPEEVPRPDEGETPDSWTWVRFGSIIGELRNGASPAPAMEPPGIPILRISAVRSGSVDLGDIRFLRDDVSSWTSLTLRDQDLLFTRYNGSLALLGVCGMARNLGDRTVLYPDKIMRVRFDSDAILPEYVELFFSSPGARERMTEGAVSSAGQQGISGATVKAQLFAVPPLEEQAQIVARSKALLRLADRVHDQMVTAERQVDRSSQAVRAKAFRGELPAGSKV